MNMRDLYHFMKDALEFFGVRFHDMHKVSVSVKDGRVTFKHEGREVSYWIGEKQ